MGGPGEIALDDALSSQLAEPVIEKYYY